MEPINPNGYIDHRKQKVTYDLTKWNHPICDFVLYPVRYHVNIMSRVWTHEENVKFESPASPRLNMMTSWNGNIFRVTGHLWWIPRTKTSDAELFFFDLRLNKRLSKQSWGRWFETLSRPLWRHRNDHMAKAKVISDMMSSSRQF